MQDNYYFVMHSCGPKFMGKGNPRNWPTLISNEQWWSIPHYSIWKQVPKWGSSKGWNDLTINNKCASRTKAIYSLISKIHHKLISYCAVWNHLNSLGSAFVNKQNITGAWGHNIMWIARLVQYTMQINSYLCNKFLQV